MIIEPLAGALGAEIRGVSLAGLDDGAWREIHRAFLEYAVLVFRDQALEPADLMRVGARSEGMRRLVDGLVGVNSAGLKHGGGRSAMHKKIGGMKVRDTNSADQYEAEHPVARTHPDTGKKALYVSRSHTIRFKGMTGEESQPIIGFLQAHQTRPEFTCRVRWTPGTLTIWDNRCTQHNAVNDYHGQRRRMRRLTVGAQTPR